MTEPDLTLIKQIAATVPSDEAALNMMIAEQVFGMTRVSEVFGIDHPDMTIGWRCAVPDHERIRFVNASQWTIDIEAAMDLMGMAAEPVNTWEMGSYNVPIGELRALFARVLHWTMPRKTSGNEAAAAMYSTVCLLESADAPRVIATAFLVAWLTLQDTRATEPFNLIFVK